MNSLIVRVVLLAALLFALNAWAVRHLGSGLRELATLNGFTVFLAMVMGWIDQRDADQWRQKLHDALRHATGVQVLASLYVIAIAATSLISSVTVLADGVGSVTTLHLTPEGRERAADSKEGSLNGPSATVRFVRFTSPFGRRFYLEASGYQRQSLTLMPWTGSTISVATDLVRLPSVLLRIPPSLHSLLAGSHMIITSSAWPDAAEFTLHADRAAVQLGPAMAIPEAWRNEWRSELRTAYDATDALRESFFRNWLHPEHADGAGAPAPGQTLTVSLKTAADHLVIQQDIVVGREPMQDFALLATSRASP